MDEGRVGGDRPLTYGEGDNGELQGTGDNKTRLAAAVVTKLAGRDWAKGVGRRAKEDGGREREQGHGGQTIVIRCVPHAEPVFGRETKRAVSKERVDEDLEGSSKALREGKSES